MRRPLLGLAACFGAGCLLSDGRASAPEVVWLAGFAALALWLAARAGLGSACYVALGGAALALGAAAAAVERLEIESRPLHRRLAQGAFAEGAYEVVGTLRGDAEERDGRLVFVLDAESVRVGGARSPPGAAFVSRWAATPRRRASSTPTEWRRG